MRRTLATCACLALALSITVAVTASASVVTSGGFKYVTKSFDLPPGKPKTFKAPCPKHHHVLGGGHYNNGLYGDVIGAHSYPYDSGDRGRKPDDGWAAQLRGFTVSYDVSIYAICAKVLPEYGQELFSVAPLSASSEIGVNCDNAALDLTSGGTRGRVSVREITGYPAGAPGTSADVWYGAVANHGTLGGDYTILNVCTGLDTARTIVQGTGSPETQQRVAAACPEATPRVVGGSARVFAPQFNTAIAASRPTPNRDGWEVWIDNYNSSDGVFIQAYAICSAPL